MTEHRPLRAVVASQIDSGPGSVLGDQGRRTRWYTMTLDCGHVVERPVKHVASATRSAGGRGWGMRPQSEVLPAPRRARCDTCPSTAGVTP